MFTVHHNPDNRKISKSAYKNDISRFSNSYFSVSRDNFSLHEGLNRRYQIVMEFSFDSKIVFPFQDSESWLFKNLKLPLKMISFDAQTLIIRIYRFSFFHQSLNPKLYICIGGSDCKFVKFDPFIRVIKVPKFQKCNCFRLLLKFKFMLFRYLLDV